MLGSPNPYFPLSPDKFVAQLKWRAFGSWRYVRQVVKRDPCVYCGSTENITCDHIIPANNGGSNNWDNQAPACYACNHRRGAIPLVLYLLVRHQTKLTSPNMEGIAKNLRMFHQLMDRQLNPKNYVEEGV